MPRMILAALCLPVLLASAAPVWAQAAPQEPTIQPLPEQPIGPFVFDARGAMARFKADASVGTALGVDANTELPTRGFGLVLGAHVYPVRRRSVALGVGGELLLRAQASRTRQASTPTGTDGPTITTTLSGVSPHVSLNFGKRDGYSYVSGGLGTARLTSKRDDREVAGDPGRVRALNYGGGARWFTGKRFAFSLDLRFYAVSPRVATATHAAYPRMRIMTVSAGLGLR